jgi:hypothetical protein
MKELSLNILDITQNSITAKAKNIYIEIAEDTKKHIILITIKDDGTGMSREALQKVADPFYTSRQTRKVGLGVPFFKMEAEMTGGSFEIKSELGAGTEISAAFKTDSLDFVPLGDIISTVCALIQGAPETDFYFTHKTDEKAVKLNTPELREVLGDGVSLGEPEVIGWIKEYLAENYNNVK